MASLPRKPTSTFEDLLGRLRAEHVSEIEKLNGEISKLRQLLNGGLAEVKELRKEHLRQVSSQAASQVSSQAASQCSSNDIDESVGEGDLDSTPRLVPPRASPTLNRNFPSGGNTPSVRGSVSSMSGRGHGELAPALAQSVSYTSHFSTDSGCLVMAPLNENLNDVPENKISLDEDAVSVASEPAQIGAMASMMIESSPRLEAIGSYDASPRSQTGISEQLRHISMVARDRAVKAETVTRSPREAEALPPVKEEPTEHSNIGRGKAAHTSQKDFCENGKVRTRDELFQAMRAASNTNLNTNLRDTSHVSLEEDSKRDSQGSSKVNSCLSKKSTFEKITFERGSSLGPAVGIKSSLKAPSSEFRRKWMSDPNFFHFQLKDEWTEVKGDEERNTQMARAASRMSLSRRRSTKNLESLVVEEEVSGYQRLLLHPSGQKRLCWDGIGMLMIGWDMVMIPLTAFEPKDDVVLDTIGWVTLLFWTFEIPMTMITGYHENGVVVLESKRIILHYLRTWFPLDLFIVAIDWFFRFQGGGASTDNEASASRLLRSFRFLRFLRTVRLLRLLKLKKILQEIEDRINSEAVSIYFNVFKIVILLLALNHIIACAWYAIGSAYESSHVRNWIESNELVHEPLIYRYATSLHWSLTQFTPASMEIRPFNVGERCFSIVVLLFALVAFSSFVSSLTSSMTHLRNIRTNETRQFWLLRRYLRDQNIPGELSRRIQRYLEYAYQRRQNRVQATEVSVLNLLSERLRDELNHEAFVDLIQAHPLFAQLNPRNKLFFKATKMEALAQGDIVFSFGFRAKCMYCLHEMMSGAEGLEYIMPDGDGRGLTDSSRHSGDSSKMNHVTDSEWICEMSLWLECWLHMGDMIAISECQVVQVDAAKFTKAVVRSPIASVTAQAYAAKFLETINNVHKELLTDVTNRMFKVGELIPLAEMRRFSITGAAGRGDFWLGMKGAFDFSGNKQKNAYASTGTFQSEEEARHSRGDSMVDRDSTLTAS